MTNTQKLIVVLAIAAALLIYVKWYKPQQDKAKDEGKSLPGSGGNKPITDSIIDKLSDTTGISVANTTSTPAVITPVKDKPPIYIVQQPVTPRVDVKPTAKVDVKPVAAAAPITFTPVNTNKLNLAITANGNTGKVVSPATFK